MRPFAPALLLLAALILCVDGAAARATAFHAGLAVLDTGADQHLSVFVWYPTESEESPLRREAYTLSVAEGAPPASGTFPLLLLSHDSFGGPLDHRELAAALARRGFVVVAPVHRGDAIGETHSHDSDLVLIGRAWQAVAALDTALADRRLAGTIDAARIGMLGLGTGGYTGLLVAGGRPDFTRWPLYCDQHMSDFELCGGSTYPAIRITRPGWRPPHDPRVKALVALAPLGLPFGMGSLDAVTIPVRLYEAENDVSLLREPNATAILAALPRPPEHVTVQGGHFVFVDPCPASIATSSRARCRDAADIDRAALHRRLEVEISDFFERVL